MAACRRPRSGSKAVGAEIWSLALKLANARLAAERESLDAARVQLEAEKQEAAELADQVTGELEALQSKVAALEASEQAARSDVIQTVVDRLNQARVMAS